MIALILNKQQRGSKVILSLRAVSLCFRDYLLCFLCEIDETRIIVDKVISRDYEFANVLVSLARVVHSFVRSARRERCASTELDAHVRDDRTESRLEFRSGGEAYPLQRSRREEMVMTMQRRRRRRQWRWRWMAVVKQRSGREQERRYC